MSEKTILFFAKIGGMDGQKYHPREGRQGVGGGRPHLLPLFLPLPRKKESRALKSTCHGTFFLLLLMIFFWGGGATLFESPPPPAKYKADARGRDVHTFSNSFLFHFAFFPLFLLFLSFFFLFFWCPRGCARGHAPPLAPPSYGTGKTTENIN